MSLLTLEAAQLSFHSLPRTRLVVTRVAVLLASLGQCATRSWMSVNLLPVRMEPTAMSVANISLQHKLTVYVCVSLPRTWSMTMAATVTLATQARTVKLTSTSVNQCRASTEALAW